MGMVPRLEIVRTSQIYQNFRKSGAEATAIQTPARL
jgi:hypothetical protein